MGNILFGMEFSSAFAWNRVAPRPVHGSNRNGWKDAQMVNRTQTPLEDERRAAPPQPANAAPSNAMDNSGSHTDTPAKIVADDSLSHDQKLRMLHEWQGELTGRSASSQDVILLRLVMAAIADVERQRN